MAFQCFLVRQVLKKCERECERKKISLSSQLSSLPETRLMDGIYDAVCHSMQTEFHLESCSEAKIHVQ